MIAQKVNVPALNPATWNTMVDTLAKRLPIRCVRTGKRWQHPWKISPEWSDNLGWVFRVNPGFVNGRTPAISTPAATAPARTLDRIEAETDKRPSGEKHVDAWLTDRPVIELGSTRIIGKGASPEEVIAADDGAINIRFEAVPKFFSTQGVTSESVIFRGGFNSGLQVVANEDPTQKQSPPILRAADVVLSVDRVTARLDLMRGNGMIDGFNALYSVVYGRTAPSRVRPRLATVTKFTAKPETELADFLQEMTDQQQDRIKIATVYLLSPKDTPPSAVPDGKWRAFIAHDVFWNLAHAPAVLPHPQDFEPLRIRTGLIGGLADTIFAGVLSPINDSMSIVTALFNQRNLAGKFWTL